MNNTKVASWIVAAGAAAVALAWQAPIFPTLKSAARIGKQDAGFYLVSTEQFLKPWGEQTLIAGRPVDLAFDSSKRILAVLNTRGVLLLDAASGATLGELRTRSTSYMGIAFRPGTHELWTSETTRRDGNLIVAEVSDNGQAGKPEPLKLEGHPVPTGISFNADGSRAFVALSRKNAVAMIDAAEKKVMREVPVGMAPFGVALVEKRGLLFVANRGGRPPAAGQTTAASSGTMMATDPRTGTTVSGTVSVIDLKTYAVKEVEVGLAPSMVAVSPDGNVVAVANGHSDTVSLIDAASLKVATVKIPAWPENTLGSQPIAVAFAPDGQRLYVACGGTNAIAVLNRDGKNWKVAGAVPTGWFPSAIAVDSNAALRVVNIKGVGNTADKKGTFNSRQFEGTLLRIPAPSAAQLSGGTREVRAANQPQFDSAGGIAKLSSLGIQHVVLIIKENRTYDQVFGDMGKGNSDPKLAMYGREVTPNHHALADQYVLLDNFYTGGAISFDGHQWLMMSFVSDYVERAFAASPRGYAWNMADSLTVAPTGFFWQNTTKPLDVRIFGEFCVPAKWNPATGMVVDINETDELKWTEYWKMYKDRAWEGHVGCDTGVPALKSLMSPRYPHSSLVIPDQIRAEEFLRELAEREKSGVMPQISIMLLNSDHTVGTRPGSPSPRAMVADNDLALGRIIEGLSKSKFWPKTLVLVVEDDAQDGVDHVDGRRTVAMAIGPHIRRGAVDSNFYTHTSMIRTIQDIFEIPSKTRFQKSARPMSSVFTADAKPTPYEAITPKIALDEMNPPLRSLAGKRLWAAQQSLAMNFRDIDDVPKDVLNRILWWEAKGYDRPFPARK